jgi:hypothetical protein
MTDTVQFRIPDTRYTAAITREQLDELNAAPPEVRAMFLGALEMACRQADQEGKLLSLQARAAFWSRLQAGSAWLCLVAAGVNLGFFLTTQHYSNLITSLVAGSVGSASLAFYMYYKEKR